LVSERARGLLRLSPCEPLLLEAASSGTEMVREPNVNGTSTIDSRYQATTSERQQTEQLVSAVVNCRVCELAITLQLLVVTICKQSINTISKKK
jgi:hypothetical protein